MAGLSLPSGRSGGTSSASDPRARLALQQMQGNVLAGGAAASPAPANMLAGAAPASSASGANLLAAGVPPPPPPPPVAPVAIAAPPVAIPGQAVAAAHGKAVRSMNIPASQVDAEMAKGEGMRNVIGPLARRGDVTHDEIIRAVGSAVADGHITPANAKAALASLPDDKGALGRWLTDRHTAIIGGLVHLAGMKATQ